MSNLPRILRIAPPCALLLPAVVAAAVLAASPPAAADASASGVVVTRVAGGDAARATNADCTVGIDGPALAGAVDFFPFPPEEFRLVFDPAISCAECSVGFEVTTVHVLLEVAEPCSLTMSASVGTVDTLTTAGCARPAHDVCTSVELGVSLPSDGVWDVAFPLACECAGALGRYTLGVKILDMTCWPVLMTTGDPNTCTNWDNIGWGWVDLPATDSTWPGDLILWADATCCVVTDAPIAAAAVERRLRIFPNPSRGGAMLSFALPSAADIELSVHDVAGRRLATLHRGVLERGTYRFAWSGAGPDGRLSPAGTYFARLVAGDRSWTRKIVVIR